MINFWDYFTVEMFAHMFSVFVLAFALMRLFRQIEKINKAIWKMQDRINELGAFSDQDMNRLVQLEQRVAKINSCKGCAPKKKVNK